MQAFIFSQVGTRAGDGVGRRVRGLSERLSGVMLVVVAIGLAIAQLVS